MKLFQNIQNQPEGTRKIIFWLALIIVAIIVLFFGAQRAATRMKSINLDGIKNDLDIPALEKELKNMPAIPGLE